MNSQQTVTSSRNDEIDLIELLKVLWNKKVWIVIFTFIFTLISGIYAFTAKEQWTSKAEVIAPKLSDLGSYFSIRKEYARILGQEFDANKLSNELFNKFNLLSESLDERRTFLENSSLYHNLSEGKDEKDKRILLSELMTENIEITKPDPKKEPDLLGRRISFSAETAIEARDTLEQLISHMGQKAYRLELDYFLIYFNELISDLNYEKEKFERDLVIQKNVQLENLNKSLKIAKEAGIKDYVNTINSVNTSELQAIALSDTKIPLSDSKLSDSSYLFMLGEKYLKAQVDVLDQQSVIYPPRYYQVSELLKELEPLLVKAKESEARAFSYQASPDYPVKRDWPRRFIILLVGAFLGGVLGCSVILARSLLMSKNN